MSTILTHAIVTNAIAAVDSYVTSANTHAAELKSIIDGLTSAGFVGDAADGFKDFYNTKVVPAIETNLTDPGQSLTASVKSIVTTIGEQLMDTVDPQLGDNNRNPGGQ